MMRANSLIRAGAAAENRACFCGNNVVAATAGVFSLRASFAGCVRRSAAYLCLAWCRLHSVCIVEEVVDEEEEEEDCCTRLVTTG